MNNINIVLEKKSNCVGCRACSNICPVNAITMQEDDEGFFYPVVNSDLCTNCGLCKKACPALGKSQVYNDNTNDPDCYAAIANDELRAVSSSGGAFSIIADKIFEMGGVVCGVAYVGQKVQHIIVEDASELYRLRGSKYLQSDTNTVFSQIKNILKTGRIVLFSGTPCQCAGLNMYLGKKYDNLYTVDLLCHGVPPQRVFDKYLEETIEEGEFVSTSFRDKKAGWNVYTTTTTTTTPNGPREYGAPLATSTYLQAFTKNMCLRPSCGKCAFTSTRREADITIGDFWRIERYKPSLNDRKGTSVLLLNSEKGKVFYELIKDKFVIQEKVPIDYAKFFNITLYTPLKQHPKRNAFFRMLNEGKSLKEITDYCNGPKYDVGILNFWTFKNMGGVIQAWALQNIVKSFGYTCALINYQSLVSKPAFSGSFVERFAKKHLAYTDIIDTYKGLSDCNENFDTFVFGSDCIWKDWWETPVPEQSFQYFGNFVNPNKKIISYAPSFGNSTFGRNDVTTQLTKYYLYRFDAISVREKSGVDILKNTFGIEGTQVLDPTLCLDVEEYNELVKKSKFDKKDYIFNYSIGIKADDSAYLEMMKKVENENIFALKQDELNKINVEDWLYLIKNSKVLITNSYHACCFALKFNIPFYIFSPYGLDTTRFDSLLGMLNLEDRILHSKEDVDKIQNIYNPIDWEKVNSIIQQEKDNSINWLKIAIDTQKNESKNKPVDDLINFLYTKIKVAEAKSVADTAKINSLQYQIDTLRSTQIAKVDLVNFFDYKKNYKKYLKYRILKNILWGETKKRYKRKQHLYHEKVRAVRNIRTNFS